MDFYTSVAVHHNDILVTGYRDGQRYKHKARYKPYMFIKSKEKGDYSTIDGTRCAKLEFDSIREAKQFIQRYDGVDNFPIFGLTNFQYTFIHDNFQPGQYDRSQIIQCILDIEVATDTGYPDIEQANNPITAITLQYDKVTFVLGYGDFYTPDRSIVYIRCKDEIDLLTKFIKIWSDEKFRPDVCTGWNIEFFDIPYCVNRITNVLGEQYAKNLSPWNILDKRTVEVFGKQNTCYSPVGINILDYYQLYKKFTYTQQESYRLDHICNIELGERKLDYSEYESLNELYKNDHQKFIEYNIKDCMLVKKLDDKMKLLDLVYTFAYDSGVNYIDSLTTVRSWDVIIHNYLLDNKIVIPQRADTIKGKSISGAYVKDPLVGMHKSIVSFDITSLYPSLIMQYNISPDTLRGKVSENISVDQFLDMHGSKYDKFCKDNNVCITANGCFYRKDKQGFIAILIEQLFNKRTQYKQNMLNLKRQYEQTKDESLLNSIAKYDILQMATKIKLNSLYGALSNEFFRWFDVRLAESITVTGQLTIRWAERYINKYLNEQLGTSNKDYCIAIDTDSLYCDLDMVVKKYNNSNKDQIGFLDEYCKHNIQPLLDKIYHQLGDYMNCYKHAIYMKRESISDSGIFVAKKRYVLSVHNNEGVQYDKPKLKMMGIEAVRSSTPMACRQAIKQLLEVILHKDEQSTIEFIEQFKKQFSSKQFEDVAFPRGVNNLDQYHDSVSIYKKATPIHVRGALLYNRLLTKHNLDNKYQRIFDKDKIKFCYLVMPNPINENVISVPGVLPKQFGLENYIDYQLMFDKSFLEPIKTVLDCIGWQTEKRNTVRGFFQ